MTPELGGVVGQSSAAWTEPWRLQGSFLSAAPPHPPVRHSPTVKQSQEVGPITAA